MRLTRRQTLLGIGGLTVGAGAVVGSGAFDTTAQRTATIDVAGDSSAMLQLESADATFVSEDGTSGELVLDFDATNSFSLNPSASTVLNPAFAVTNPGSSSVFVDVVNGTLGSALTDLAFVFVPGLNDGTAYNGVTATDVSQFSTPTPSVGYIDDRATAEYTDPQGATTTDVPVIGTVNTNGYIEVGAGNTLVVSALVVTTSGSATDDQTTFTVEAFEASSDLTNSGDTQLVGTA